jgi:CIC family chloride channel protein
MPINKETIRQHLRNYPVDLLLPIAVGFICGWEAVFIRTFIPLTFGRVIALASVNDQLTVPVIFAFLLIGAYLTGLIAERMQEVSGFGLDVAIESYHSNAGRTTARFAPLKFLATLLTLGSGGSGGLVGPTAAIGQGTASYFSRWFKLSQDRSRILALCGIAACVSGLLHTPFGAAVFALELCYMGSIVYEDLIPVLLSSVSAYIMSARIVRTFPFGHLLEQPHLFRTIVHDTAFPWSLDYLAYCVVAALFTTLLGILFIKTYRAFERFNKIEIKSRYGPVIGSLFVGLVAALFFRHRLADVLSHPGDQVERCATEGYSLNAAAGLLIGRWVTTFLTIGFGGSGGLFSPIVLMGGLSGTIVARVLGTANVKVLVTTGIAAALAGVINVPMAAVILVVEVFGVSFIIPAAIGSAIAFLLARNVVIFPHIQQRQESVEP